MRSLSTLLFSLAVAVVLSIGSPAAFASQEPARVSDTEPSSPEAAGEETSGPPSIEEMVEGLERRDGLFTLYLDRDAGKLWVELPPPGGDGTIGRYLYAESLAVGLGSNPVNLDRGQINPALLLRLRRVGGRVMAELENHRFRALSADPLEREAVAESFATSVLWAGEVAAVGEDGSLLVDWTSFVVRDAHDVAGRLREREEGSFSLDRERSAVDLDAALAFPDNVELEALLTFTGQDAGAEIRATAPDPRAVTLVQHHSILRLPDDDFEPRPWDPRAGSYAVRYADYAVPLTEPVARRLTVRLRSPTEEPIVFYVDPGTPEPVRSALVDGASWWAEAFAAAGFPGSFRVELLPEGAHPLDARYHVIQWVHRATRGWSYGGGIVDPRTGEMVKGHVNLGSLRVRQDRLIFEGLLGAEGTGSGEADDPVELALARIRQLSAHEVGHALGLAHNFAGSTYGRASVMDYPAPLVRLTPEGGIDVSAAYAVGVGEWDVHAVRYAYAEPPAGTPLGEFLDRVAREGVERGLVFLTDSDARPPGAANPLAALWDNGEDPVDELVEVLAVRRAALERFGERNLVPGTPLALLQETLVPIYFFHRYQVEAAAKVVGGLTYTHALAGDGQDPARPVPAADQRRALAALLAALDPAVLDLPDDLLAQLLPRPPEHPPNRELFRGAADPVFDPLSAAAAAADLPLDSLLQRERAIRLVDQHRRDAELPGLEEILDAVVGHTFHRTVPDARHAEVARVVQGAVVARLIELARDPATALPVRSRVEGRLRELGEELVSSVGSAEVADLDAEAHHRLFLGNEIRRFLTREGPPSLGPQEAPPAPPGSPIGGLSGCSGGK